MLSNKLKYNEKGKIWIDKKYIQIMYKWSFKENSYFDKVLFSFNGSHFRLSEVNKYLIFYLPSTAWIHIKYLVYYLF